MQVPGRPGGIRKVQVREVVRTSIFLLFFFHVCFLWVHAPHAPREEARRRRPYLGEASSVYRPRRAVSRTVWSKQWLIKGRASASAARSNLVLAPGRAVSRDRWLARKKIIRAAGLVGLLLLQSNPVLFSSSLIFNKLI